MESEWFSHNFEVWKDRESAGFVADEKNDIMYCKWNQPIELGGFNPTFMARMLTTELLDGIVEKTKGYKTSLFSKECDLDKKFPNVLKLNSKGIVYKLNAKKLFKYKSNLQMKKVENVDELRQWAEKDSQLFKFETTDFVFDSFKKDLEIGCASYYMGFIDDELVATVQNIYGRNSVGIYSLGVEESHRRKGYGRDLTAFSINDSIEKGCNSFLLKSSDIALGVYKSLGFVDDDILYSYNFI